MENNFFGIRRSNQESGNALRFGDLVLTILPKVLNEDVFKGKAFSRDLNITLSNTTPGESASVNLNVTEYELMHLLLSAASTNRQLTSGQIFQWMNFGNKTRSVIYLSLLLDRLRKKLEKIKSKVEIYKREKNENQKDLMLDMLIYNPKKIIKED